MATECSSIKKGKSMKGTGLKMSLMARGRKLGRMAVIMKESIGMA